VFCSIGGRARGRLSSRSRGDINDGGGLAANGNPVNGQVWQRDRQGGHGGIHQINHRLKHGLENGDRVNEGRSDGPHQVICSSIKHGGSRDGHGRDSAGRNHTVHHR
jgi:hypothetical protein